MRGIPLYSSLPTNMTFPLFHLLAVASVFFFCFIFFFFSTFRGTTHLSSSHPNHLQLVSHVSLPPINPPSPSPSQAPSPFEPTKVFSVLSYGAVGDGEADDTLAFKMAWDAACSQTQSAHLVAPAPYRFIVQPTVFAGPCQTNNLLFQIDGTIMAPDGPTSWPNYSNKRQWLVFYNVTGLTMQGDGIVDGRGHKWWDLPCKPHKGINGTATVAPPSCDSPVAIRFFMSSNLTVQGLKVHNSPQFHFRFDHCRNVVVQMLNIKSPSFSPNTDGIHIENSNNFILHSSLISNGDDCVSIGAGSYNVHIQNITCGPSHGISIGSLGFRNSRACVSNITVSDSFIHHSQNGVRIKTWQGGYGSVTRVKFHNIWMQGVRNPVIIDQYYCLSKNCSNQTSGVYIHDVSYSNIRGTYDVRSPPMHLACSDSVPCTNLELSDIVLLPGAAGDGQVAEKNPFCWNAYGGNQTLIIPPVSCLMGGSPDLIMDSKDDLC